MTEIDEEIEQVSGIESKFTRIALTVVAVLLLFAGPTYLPYLMVDVLQINYFAGIGTGAVLFVVGLVMLFYLIRKRVIT
ncbi:MAG: hypothetical protein ACQCN6_12760 [Candidatus Bathyarchaeia archaeon]|jgi:hypothetical protein